MRGTFIATRILVQIQLMIRLGIIPLLQRQHLRRHLARTPPLALHLLRHGPRNSLLLFVLVEDGAAILRACVAALAVLGRGVMHLIEEFEESAVGDFGRVKRDLEGFGVWK